MVIRLFCAYGMSTDVLVQKMKKFVDENDTVEAFNVNELEQRLEGCDVVLLGPQARMYLRKAQQTAEPYGVPVEVIDMMAYGRADGNKVYEQAKRMYREKQQN